MAKITSMGSEQNTTPRGLPPCPSCGAPCEPKQLRCEACGHVLVTDPGSDAPRLDDSNLTAQLRSLNTRKNIMFGLTALCLVAAAGSALSGAWIPLGIGLLAGAVCVVVGLTAKNKVRELFKSNVVQDALSGIFSDCVYLPERSLGDETIAAAELIGGWNRCYGEDYVSGTYKGHRIEYSDVRLAEVTTHRDSNGNKSRESTTVFHGQWMTCKLDRPVEHMVRIRENAERAGLSKKLFGSHLGGNSDIETENAAFNRQFQILTDDPHTAFYILTPHFMEYIVAADQQANGRIYLGFTGDTLHIAVWNNRDSFEVKGGDVKNLPALRARLQGEISLITSILDELFQNENLF